MLQLNRKSKNYICMYFLIVGITLACSNQTAFAYSVDKKFTVTIQDEIRKGNLNNRQRQLLKKNIIAAMKYWLEHLAGHGEVVITVKIDKTATGRASGRSISSHFVRYEGNKAIFEQSLIAKLQRNKDVTGAKPDVELVLDPNYMHLLWFDPNPEARNAKIPQRKLDALSMLIHEFGHAIAFNGWINQSTGRAPGNTLSTYDKYVRYKNGKYFFHGPKAIALYGKPIRLGNTHNNYMHLGDTRKDDPLLVRDLMNGVVLEYQYRYYISKLDLAILEDCGIRLR